MTLSAFKRIVEVGLGRYKRQGCRERPGGNLWPLPRPQLRPHVEIYAPTPYDLGIMRNIKSFLFKEIFVAEKMCKFSYLHV